MNFLRAIILLLLVVLLAPVAVPIPGTSNFWDVHTLQTQASTIAGTTAAYDAGTKTSAGTATDTCENVTSPALLQLNNSGNYQGIGLTTGTSTCATGAWNISSSSLQAAYDMQTFNSPIALRDFSGNGHAATPSMVTNASAIFGRGLSFPGTDSNRLNAPSSAGFTLGSGFTLAVHVRFAAVAIQMGLLERYDQLSNGGWGFRVAANHTLACFTTSGAPATILYTTQVVVPGFWYVPVCTWTGTQIAIYLNGTLLRSGADTVVPGESSGPLRIGCRGDDGSLCLNGTFDESEISSRVWSPSEILAFSTDGRSSFLSSGSWTSPRQTSPGLVPTQLSIQAVGITAALQVAYVNVVNATGGVIWNGTGSSTTNWYVFNVPVLSEARNGWGVRIGLSGSGSATPALIAIVATLTTPNPSGSPGPPWSIACTFNPLLVSWSCADSTDYTHFYPGTLHYSYDGAPVGTTAPDTTFTFRPYNQTWYSLDATHTLIIAPEGPVASYSLTLKTTELPAWLLVAFLLFLITLAWFSNRRADSDRRIYFLPVTNPSYRDKAVSVEEYPKGWQSYRQTNREFPRYRSVRRGDRWFVYGIRPATKTEQEQTGRKHIGELQTVRERL